MLLMVREQTLIEYGFTDVYWDIKTNENIQALALLPSLLTELDELEMRQRNKRLIEGCLAGNCFDWGASASINLLEKGRHLCRSGAARVLNRACMRCAR